VAQTVDEIVARHIAARGGRDKLAAIQTVKLTRTVGNGIGTPLKVVIYKKRPNLFRLEQTPAQPGATMTPRGINAETVWDFAQGKPVPRETQLAAEARELEGVKFAFDITEERTGKEPVVTLVTYTENIEVNVPMDDRLFAMPVK
jgi:hypothetical protein